MWTSSCYILSAIVFYSLGPHPIPVGANFEDGGNMTLHVGDKKFLGRTLLVSAAFLGMLAFAGAPRASADDYDKCQRRIAKADHRLHEAIEDHGWYSRQANHARHEFQQAPERCWNQ